MKEEEAKSECMDRSKGRKGCLPTPIRKGRNFKYVCLYFLLMHRSRVVGSGHTLYKF
jgi:hypothetical protein